MELVFQRDGKPSGRALFHVDIEKQKAKEFTIEQRKKYDEVYGGQLDEMIAKAPGKKSNPDANADKRAHTTGDI